MSLFPVRSTISAEERNALMRQRPLLIWFTGFSGAGKSTIAAALERALFEKGFKTFHLDGDNVRQGLNQNLGFSEADRKENIRRVGEVSKLMLDAGLIVLSAFISPFSNDRETVKKTVGADYFFEVFVNCPIEVCEQRDVKGLYQKARAGSLPDFTGIDSPYEVPHKPSIEIRSNEISVAESVELLLEKIIPIIQYK